MAAIESMLSLSNFKHKRFHKKRRHNRLHRRHCKYDKKIQAICKRIFSFLKGTEQAMKI